MRRLSTLRKFLVFIFFCAPYVSGSCRGEKGGVSQSGTTTQRGGRASHSGGNGGGSVRARRRRRRRRFHRGGRWGCERRRIGFLSRRRVSFRAWSWSSPPSLSSRVKDEKQPLAPPKNKKDRRRRRKEMPLSRHRHRHLFLRLWRHLGNGDCDESEKIIIFFLYTM